MKRKLSFFILLFSVLLLGAKSCDAGAKAGTGKTPPVYEINTKEDIIELLPELNKYAGKFEVRRYDDFIQLLTYDDLSFKEAVHKLKTQTSMNRPAYIFLYTDKALLIDEGELKSENSVQAIVSFTGRDLAPYLGIIFINDGYWTAVEFNANALFSGKTDVDGTVLVTEYAYVNDTVYKKNRFSSERGILSRFDKGDEGEPIEGDGSILNEIITEFDR